jgi:hypothetical protein
MDVSLRQEKWHADPKSVATSNLDGSLVISGDYETNRAYFDRTLPLFAAKQAGLELNFSETPYLMAVISSQPDAETSLDLGWHYRSQDTMLEFTLKHGEAITEIDPLTDTVWINISYPFGGEKVNGQTSHITIDVAERLARLGLENECFVGLEIKQYPVAPLSLGNHFETRIESISLTGEIPYEIVETNGTSLSLPDGSTAQIIKRANIANNFEDWPHLQRVYILYKIDAPQNALYTVFLLLKHDGNLTAVRSGFVFAHQSLLNEVGTFVDWRKPIVLDPDFEPIQVLHDTMESGDYAIIFTPVNNSRLQSTQMSRVVLTFSQLPYSAFVMTTLDQGFVSTMSFLVAAIVGAVPTALMLALFYIHKKRALNNTKKTIVGMILVGLGLRLILAAISAYADDTQIFSEIGALYYGSGVLGAQWVSLPGFVYVETAAYFPYALMRAIGFQDVHFLALDVYCVELLFTKIPAILSDIGSFYFIWKIADKISPKNKPLIAGLYLLNPLTLYISGVLGQFDSVFAFVLIAFTYYLIVNHNVLRASLFSSFAAIINPIGMATIIPLFSTVLVRKNWRNAIASMLLIVGVLGVLLAPFYFEPNSPVLLTSYERLIAAVPGEGFYGRQISFYAYGTRISSLVGYGLTFRFMLEIFGLELGWWYYPLAAGVVFLAFVVAFSYKMHKTPKTDQHIHIYAGTFMLGVVCLFLLTFPTIYEQFAVWLVGLLLISYTLNREKKTLFLFVLTCVSSGAINVARWGVFLQLASGVEVVQLGDLGLQNMANALLGMAYSAVVAVIFVSLCKTWFKEELSRFCQLVKLRFRRSG